MATRQLMVSSLKPAQQFRQAIFEVEPKTTPNLQKVVTCYAAGSDGFLAAPETERAGL
jgi:hypothetical protein